MGSNWPAILAVWGLISGLQSGELVVDAQIRAQAPPAARSKEELSSTLAQASSGHWAFRRIQKPRLPVVSAPAGEILTGVDAFLWSRLASKGLAFSPPADRRTLLRRVWIDLTGLPPAYDELEAFLGDHSPDAYERVVERLLASPRYGERWGRHWLDVARYAETKDLVLLYGKERLRPYAYTYRDYVIRAFNEDLPFDRFVREQLAADQLPSTSEPWRLAAMGFLTVGRLYDNNVHDIIDDQIDTVTRGFLGLTVSCARCHDHKYDAIPTEDYYSLYGVFASSEHPYDLPLIEDPERVHGGPAFEKQLGEARKKLNDLLDAEYAKQMETARRRVGDYLVRVATTKPDISETAIYYLSLQPDDLRPGLVNRWRRHLAAHASTSDRLFGLWSTLMGFPEDRFADQAAALLRRMDVGDGAEFKDWNGLVRRAFHGVTLTNKAHAAMIYGELLRTNYERSSRGRLEARRPVAPDGEGSAASIPGGATLAADAGARFGLDGDAAELASLLTSRDGPVFFARSETPLHLSRTEKDRYGGFVKELDRIAAFATNAPPGRAMVMRDLPEPVEPRVFVRGSPARVGSPVARQFLKLISGSERRPFERGSGRLELAEAIVSRDNPLTARVFANRVWMHHMGEPLASAASDFGLRSEPPVHEELLDHLASLLLEHSWSVKRLHREILFSAAYRQGSSGSSRGEALDVENALYWKFPRRRLDLESMRDSLLFASGRLDLGMGGRSVDVAGDATDRRRTVYGLVDRQDLPGMFRAFDFASPDQSAERRPRTMVAQQALFALNSPFMILQAKAIGEWMSSQVDGDPAARVERLYRRVHGRNPLPEEIRDAVSFVSDAEGRAGGGGLSQWAQLAQILLMSNEFAFVE